MRLGRAEKHAVRHNGRAAPADLQRFQEQSKEKQLRLFRGRYGEQVFGDGFLVQAAGEGRVGHDEGVFIAVGIVLGKGVHPADVGRFHAVEHHVHGSDAQHGLVGVEAGEHGGGVMTLVLGFHQIHGVMLADVLRRGADKARAAHGGV